MSGSPHTTSGSPDATAEPPRTADARTGPVRAPGWPSEPSPCWPPGP
ncbi:hypothetical protein GTX14_25530 [Streptomyces sp. SID4944]|nr:hypothetical protein [Streptomyces sp. SID4944]